jgi:hypothetical protein
MPCTICGIAVASGTRAKDVWLDYPQISCSPLICKNKCLPRSLRYYLLYERIFETALEAEESDR